MEIDRIGVNSSRNNRSDSKSFPNHCTNASSQNTRHTRNIPNGREKSNSNPSKIPEIRFSVAGFPRIQPNVKEQHPGYSKHPGCLGMSQTGNKSFTVSRSFRSSARVAVSFSLAKSSCSRPCTICRLTPSEVSGKLEIKPSSTP